MSLIIVRKKTKNKISKCFYPLNHGGQAAAQHRRDVESQETHDADVIFLGHWEIVIRSLDVRVYTREYRQCDEKREEDVEALKCALLEDPPIGHRRSLARAALQMPLVNLLLMNQLVVTIESLSEKTIFITFS